MKNQKGFSLVELLVVVTIIAILSVTAFIALGGQTLRARNSKRQEHLTTIQSALEIYFVQNNRYPTATELAAVPATNPMVPEFISEISQDPAGDPYVYATNGTNRNFQLGATLENDAGGFTALIIGNSETALITAGVLTDGTGGACATVADGSTACVPYIP